MAFQLSLVFIFVIFHVLSIQENVAIEIDSKHLRDDYVKYHLDSQINDMYIEPDWVTKIKLDASSDIDLDPGAMISQNGYPVMSYKVTTQDGYILTVYRIPPNKTGVGNGHPVFLQHGLIASAADWILMGPGKGLAYLLADMGYDVWLGNCRGNTYSRAHVSLSTSQEKYWRFSFHEMGYYDLPAVTEFVLKNSKDTQLTYIGHSMGTTMFFVFCATRPELQHRIRQMHALAPVAFMTNLKSPLRFAAPSVNPLMTALNLAKQYEFLPHGGPVGLIVEAIFKRDLKPVKIAAEEVLFLICGTSRQEFNQTLLPLMVGHTPAGTSVRAPLHYLQEINSGFFRQFDEGDDRSNINRYGTKFPPQYNLSAITVPIALHYSENDYLAAVQDVQLLHSKLKSSIGLFRVPLPSFNHLDFTFGNNVDKLVYSKIIDLMAKKESKSEVTELKYNVNMVKSVLKSSFDSILDTLGSEIEQLMGSTLENEE